MRIRFVHLSFVVMVLAAIVHVSCTANQRAKSHGGTMTIDLPPGQKLISATWKDDNLWYLTRPMRKDDIPEVMMFRESSNLGILQGTVIIQESRK